MPPAPDPEGATGSAADGAGGWDAEIASTRLLYGAGRAGELGGLAAELGCRRPLLVSDPGLRRAGHTGAAQRRLESAGMEVALFDGVEPNPTSRHVDDGVAAARAARADAIVVLGGGSAMDCAKAINLVYSNGGSIEDYWGFGKARRPLRPSLAVPTTAGTGSDAQSYAIIARPGSGRKMACGDRGARFRTVLLDPELAATAPREVIASAGIDAISHAVETAVTVRRTPVSTMLAAEAWRLLDDNLEAALAGGAPTGVYGRMLVGSHLAGAAIEASMLGGAHAAANPLTARHQILHGEAVGLMLPPVVRHNSAAADAGYRRLAPGGAEEVADRVEQLRREAGLPERLRDRGVGRDDLPTLARLAVEEWTGRYNPRPLGESEFLQLYESAY